LIEQIGNQDFNTRKGAIQAISTIARVVPITLKPFKQDVVEMLGDLRTDKMKPVRDAAVEALVAMKEVPDSGE